VIAVTGATGGVGGRVAPRLAERGAELRLIVRDPSRAPELPGAELVQVSDYGNGEEMRRALDGAERLLLVSFEESRDRLEKHKAAIDAAVAAGVGHVVYTSYFGAAADAIFLLGRNHFQTEEHLRASGVEWTMLRDNIYLDVLPFFAAEGEIRGPAGDGSVAAVARDDVADVAVEALTGDGHAGQAYPLTGPEAITMTEAAARLSAFIGRPIEYVEETVDEAWESRRPSGAPDWLIDVWVSTYTAIAGGEVDGPTDTVERVTGRPPIDLEETLRRTYRR
jgi:NAD(P)H dehydrogenase (quinone)